MPARSSVPVDGFTEAVSQRIGGPVGRRAGGYQGWWNPARIMLAIGTLTYLAGVLFHLPCRFGADQYAYLCYSDIRLLYSGRGLLAGNTPYLDSGNYPVLEYPVLTGWFLELERLITVVLGGVQGPAVGEKAAAASTLIFVDVNTVLLGALFLIALWAQIRTVEGRSWDAMMLAASPCVAATVLINWDLLVVALTSLAMLCWARRKPALAGICLGLGMAAKLYPALLLGPLLLLCLRGRRMPEFLTMLSTFVISWGVANLPALALAPQAWLSFWSFNSDRGGDLGSIWYVLSLAGHEVADLNLVSAGLFAVLCLAIGALIIFAPRMPRFGAMAFLVVAAFLLTNKVYSPQYVLWLLPLLILARPRWRDWLIFTAGELIYFVAIWWHLGGLLSPGDSSADRVYWLAVLTRLATQTWVVIMVVRDALRPAGDPARGVFGSDPTGGVLNDVRPRARAAVG